MIDIHTHILPNIDDGANSLELSLLMIDEEIKNGINEIVLTPHFNSLKNNDEYIQKVYESFHQLKSIINDKVSLKLGFEIFYQDGDIDLIKKNPFLTIDNTKYVLIEFHMLNTSYDIDEICYSFIVNGFKPILAHPERYEHLSVDDILRIKKTGALIQVNSSSILGDFGKKIQKKVWKLLKKDGVDYIASDCHSMGIRKPNIQEAIKLVNKKLKKVWENKQLI